MNIGLKHICIESSDTTRPPSKVFTVIASISREWNEKFAIPCTTEYKQLKKKIEDALKKELTTLERFIEVSIIRFFKGSIRFEFRVYFEQSSPVNEDSLSTKIQNTDAGELGDIEVIQVENDKERTKASQDKSKPFLELWLIIVIAAGGVILIYNIIIIVLMVGILRLHITSYRRHVEII